MLDYIFFEAVFLFWVYFSSLCLFSLIFIFFSWSAWESCLMALYKRGWGLKVGWFMVILAIFLLNYYIGKIINLNTQKKFILPLFNSETVRKWEILFSETVNFLWITSLYKDSCLSLSLYSKESWIVLLGTIFLLGKRIFGHNSMFLWSSYIYTIKIKEYW